MTDPASAQVTPAATLDGTAPSAVWDDLANALEPAIRDAVRELLAHNGPTHHAVRADVLLEAGISADEAAVASALASIFVGYDRAPETDAHERAKKHLRLYGQPNWPRTLGQHLPLSAVGDGPLALLDAVDGPPTVAIRLREAFFEQRADQRRDLCRLLAELAQVADVRLLAKRCQQRKLAELHRADLPGVSEACSAGRGTGPLTTVVETARSALDSDSRPVALLRALAAEPGETLSYGALYAEAPRRREEPCSAVPEHAQGS